MRHRMGILLLAVAVALPSLGYAVGEGGHAKEAQRALEPLVKDYEKATEAMREEMAKLRETEEYKKAREAREFEKINAMFEAISKPVMEHWRAEFTKAAERFAGTEGEVVFAAALLEHRLVEDMPAMVSKILGAHPKSAHLVPILDVAPFMVRMGKKTELYDLLEKVIMENPSDEVRAYAHFARARGVGYDSGATAAEKERAEADRQWVVDTMPEDSLVSMKARGPKFKEERLQIGMQVPDIEGVDLFGESFKLSDYRGKVIMLDFWGDW